MQNKLNIIQSFLESIDDNEKEFVDFLMKELDKGSLYEFMGNYRTGLLREALTLDDVKLKMSNLRSKLSDRELVNAFIDFLPKDKLYDFINWCNITYKLYRSTVTFI